MNEENVQVEQEVVQAEPVQQVQQESQQQMNFRMMRERAERAEQRARELEQSNQGRQAISDDYEGPDDEGLVEGKHLKKHVKSIKEELRETKKQLEAFRSTSAEMQLRSKFNDFDKIVTNENLERLSREKPALYRSLMANPALYDKGELAYESIATYLQPAKSEVQDKKLEENKAKPRAASSVSPQASDSPLSRAGDYDRRILSKDRQAELYREMMLAKNQY